MIRFLFKRLLSDSAIQQFESIHNTMKAFCIVLLSCLAVASAQVDCQTCKDGVTKLGTYLTSDAELAAEVALLKATVCEPSGDPTGCAAGVDLYWADIAKAIFTYPETATDVCTAGGVCKKFSRIPTRAIACDVCEGLLGQFGDLLADSTFITTVLDKVSTFLYCDTIAEPTACKAFVATYGPLAMPALGSAIQVEGGRICGELGCE